MSCVQKAYTCSNVIRCGFWKILLTCNACVYRRVAVKLTFVEPDGEEIEVDAKVGESLLDVAHDNDVEMEGKPKR